jgi:hypothetical protein
MKTTTIIGVIAFLQLTLAAQPAFAQVNEPYTPEAKPPIIKEEPKAPIQPAPAASSQETTGTKKTPAKTTTTQEPDSGNTVENIKLPEPVLPIINLDNIPTATDTQQSAYTDIDTNQIAASIIGPYLNNQIRIVLVTFLGAISGSILTLLLLILSRMIRRRAK